MKRTIIILVILVAAGLVAFRMAHVISAKKEEPKKRGIRPVPLVEVVPVTQGLIEEKISRNGDIAPKAQVTIYSKVQGWVGKIHVREGDLVKIGQEIVTLDKREAEAAVAQAQASLEAVKARLKQVRETSEETVQSQIQHTNAPMAIAVIGGLSVSTLLTLVFIPTLYTIFETRFKRVIRIEEKELK